MVALNLLKSLFSSNGTGSTKNGKVCMMSGKILNPLFGMPWLPINIIISENDNTDYKRYDSQILVGNITKNEFIVYM